MKTISVIKNRGQLTIPDVIRKMAKQTDIWSGIKKARSTNGKGQALSATNFLRKDRISH